jgi:predicted PurR-regulated permease PerM
MIVGALVVVRSCSMRRGILHPLFVSLFMSYALSPVVDWMERCHLPRAASAAMTMISSPRSWYRRPAG